MSYHAGGTEAETEELMYQAIAAKMQTDGLDVTTEDVRQVVEEQSSATPPEPSEEDAEILNTMAEYQAEHMRPTPDYVVRGALLQCSFGSHCRKLNLPLCHGVYITGHPAMNQKDCMAGIEGPMFHITSFGVCKSPTNQTGAAVTMVSEAPRNPDGSFTGVPPVGMAVGMPCIPIIIGEWDNPHSDTKIGGSKSASLTTESFLVCAHGGLIRVWRSGQGDK